MSQLPSLEVDVWAFLKRDAAVHSEKDSCLFCWKESSLEEEDFSFEEKFALLHGREGDGSNLHRQTDISEIHKERIDFSSQVPVCQDLAD